MFIYIYKLIKKGAVNDDMVYIGSTTDVKKRMYSHINKCINPKSPKYNLKVYNYIRENGGIDEWEMIIIDKIEVPLKKCEERSMCEQDYIAKYDAVNKLNSFKAFRTEEDKRVNKLNKAKKYQLNNLEKISERQKIRYYNMRENDKEYFIKKNEKNKEKISCDICGSLVRKVDILIHQQTQKCINFKNCEKYREKIKERTSQKISCDICGAFSSKYFLARHQRSQKCINFKNLAI